MNKILIISLHPEAALRGEDRSLAAAALSSEIPTKQHRQHRPIPETLANPRPVPPAVPPMPGAEAAPLEPPPAVWRPRWRTAHRTTDSSFRSPRPLTYAAGPEFAALSANA